ncbi:MAG: UDP-N-acetylmuramoyl-L-alanyl-D-glutamate--2,6-diaminopimelate ligase [Deferrisomatales bacterium]|nr:UDP-N-acetylmuramoyl-L-alanyl-D-glutamate--2,6-diaminopimelate ligase [Deferrisomatales bacterium]
MRLSRLLQGMPVEHLDPGDPEVAGVACDSRAVGPGGLFVALRGSRADGHDHLETAARAGAVACLIQDPRPGFGMVRVRVPDPEAALGRTASAFYGHPSRALRLVGITGTNGKTTTAYLIQHLLEASRVRTGRLGTVSYAFPRGEEPAPLTTPDAPTLQAALARMRDEGAAAVVMEVSSHALVRRRVEGCAFACAVFTNLSQDHLDFHGSMEAYFESKRLLFSRYAPEAPAVLNAEDPYGRRLLADASARVVTYGLRAGEVRFELEELGPRTLRGTVCYPGGRAAVQAPMVGELNAWNVACALATTHALGLDVAAAAAALENAPPIPGRLELVDGGGGLSVFVDYAHTPDALERALTALRGFGGRRVLCVFGCGGDRDRAKRPLMARAAASWSDALVLTADNSRSESTEAILDAVEDGLPPEWRPAASPRELAAADRSFARVPDRAEAIRWAIRAARPGDVVLIAGKGHETTQALGDRVLPFDDRLVARAMLREGAGP